MRGEEAPQSERALEGRTRVLAAGSSKVGDGGEISLVREARPGLYPLEIMGNP